MDNLLDKTDEKMDMLTDFNDDSSSIKDSELFMESGSDKYFKPIEKMSSNSSNNSNSFFNFLKSASGSKCATPTQSNQSGGNLLSLLNSGGAGMSPGVILPKPQNTGQVHSVEELEAGLRHTNNDSGRNENEQKVLQNFFQTQLNQQPQPQPPVQQKPQNLEDVNAFKKLLSQITNDNDPGRLNSGNMGGMNHPQHSPHYQPPIIHNTPQQQSTQNILQQLMNKSNFQPQPQQQINPGLQDIMTQFQQQQKFVPPQNHPNLQKPIPGPAPPGNGMPKIMNPIGPQMPSQRQQNAFGSNPNDIISKFGQMKSPSGYENKYSEILKRPETQSLLQGKLKTKVDFVLKVCNENLFFQS